MRLYNIPPSPPASRRDFLRTCGGAAAAFGAGLADSPLLRAGIDGSAPIQATASAAATQNTGNEPAPHPFPGGFPVQNLPVHPTPDPSNQ